MYCKKCGNEISDESIFCDKCRSKEVKGTNKNIFLRFKNLNYRLLLFSLTGVLIIAVIMIVIFLKNPTDKFKDAINENEFIKASEIYFEEIRGNINDENEIIDFLKSKIDDIKKDFDENKLEYNDAITQLDIIEKTGIELPEVTNAKSEISRLNDSRAAFIKGKEFLDKKNYKDALDEFKKVISEDENYSKAQEFIDSYAKDYKTIILSEAEIAANSNDYGKALTLLNEALTLIPNDSDLSEKKVIYEKLNKEKEEAERKKIMEELKNKEEVSVENISTFLDSSDSTYISIVVKNNTNKVVKKYAVGWMGFDESGYPIKTGWLLPDYLKEGFVEANIEPGMTYGSENCWRISDDDIPEDYQFLACVRRAEYHDGSQWDNPYYDYWVREYMQKPLR